MKKENDKWQKKRDKWPKTELEQIESEATLISLIDFF
jgi:hypothetical protein